MGVTVPPPTAAAYDALVIHPFWARISAPGQTAEITAE
jgi:hypothetical protein